MRILLFLIPGHSKVSDACISSSINNDVFWLDVAVYDVPEVQVVESFDKASYKKL